MWIYHKNNMLNMKYVTQVSTGDKNVTFHTNDGESYTVVCRDVENTQKAYKQLQSSLNASNPCMSFADYI